MNKGNHILQVLTPRHGYVGIIASDNKRDLISAMILLEMADTSAGDIRTYRILSFSGFPQPEGKE